MNMTTDPTMQSTTMNGMTHEMTHHMHTNMNHDNSTHGDHDPMMHMMMQMTFHLSTQVTILFEQWTVDSTGGLIGSCFAVFFMAMFYEGLKVGRELLLRRSVVNVRYHSQQISKDSETFLTETHNAGESSLLSWGHLLQTFLHMIQVTISYFLMLIFMTYNGWLCIAVVLGAGTGYLVFGWKKAIVVDINEHCH